MQIAYSIRRISSGVTRGTFYNRVGKIATNYEGGVMKHSISYLCSSYARRKKFVAEIFTLDCIEG